MSVKRQKRNMMLVPLIGIVMAGCTPTVQLQAPEKPIEINLNVNIEHRVKVEIERDVRESISKNKDIF